MEVKTSVLFNAGTMEMHPAVFIAKLKWVQSISYGASRETGCGERH